MTAASVFNSHQEISFDYVIRGKKLKLEKIRLGQARKKIHKNYNPFDKNFMCILIKQTQS